MNKTQIFYEILFFIYKNRKYLSIFLHLSILFKITIEIL